MSEKFEANEDVSGSQMTIRAVWRSGQTFTPQVDHYITNVKVYGERAGIPTYWTLYCYIYLADGNHKPTGSPVASGSKPSSEIGAGNAWTDIEVQPQDYVFQADTEYVIVLAAPDAGSGHGYEWQYQTTNPYGRGIRVRSINSGSSWDIYTSDDHSFQEWGEYAFIPPEIETLDAYGIKSDQATLATKVIDDKGKTLSVRHNYGKTEAYGESTPWQEGKHTDDVIAQTITDLDPETEYHFRGEAVYED